jgi:uncharacterized protein
MFCQHIDYQRIIDLYYPEENALKKILTVHSRGVADKALRIIDKHPELQLDKTFVEAAAMLHDIGIIGCDAPGIQCFGSHPYICHGRIGAQMLRELPQHIDISSLGINDETLQRLARVCERHTGAGLTREDIINQQLPLPQEDFLPESMEEQLICYADKFFSKTKLTQEKTIEQAMKSLAKFGSEGVSRFQQWILKFE